MVERGTNLKKMIFQFCSFLLLFSRELVCWRALQRSSYCEIVCSYFFCDVYL